MFADIHIHPSLDPWNGERGSDALWDDRPPVGNQQRRPYTTYLQSDFTSLARSGTRLVWLSLYPIERGFCRRPPFPVGWMGTDAVLRKVTGLTRDRVRLHRGPDYDEFAHLEAEYAFVLEQHGVEHAVATGSGTADWSYRLTRDHDDVEAALASERTIAVVLSLEGAHAFGAADPHRPLDPDQVLANVDRVRAWRYPLFCLTFAHHFHNGLCGHARSIYAPFDRLLDQRHPAMELGFNELGRTVLERVLERDARGRRILVDLKHMSLASRWQVYRHVESHNARHADDPIPLVVTHFACNGRAASILEQLEDLADTDRHFEETPGPFNPWTLNFSDEEIRRIVASGGLLGLILDQRVLSSRRELQRVRAVRPTSPDYERTWASLLVNHIVHAARACRTLPEPDQVWHVLALGSDFDGKINPLDPFPTVLQYPRLERVLIEALAAAPGIDDLLDGLDPAEAARKICFDNVRAFGARHHRARLPSLAGA